MTDAMKPAYSDQAETYRITGQHGSTGEYIDVVETFEPLDGVASAREVAEDWAYSYLDKGHATLTRIVFDVARD